MVSVQRITDKAGESVGFRTVRRFRDIVNTHRGNVTVTAVLDPRLSNMPEFIKPSLCKRCRVEQSWTSGFHKGWCSACCMCDRHRGERDAMRLKGLVVVH